LRREAILLVAEGLVHQLKKGSLALFHLEIASDFSKYVNNRIGVEAGSRHQGCLRRGFPYAASASSRKILYPGDTGFPASGTSYAFRRPFTRRLKVDSAMSSIVLDFTPLYS
jgi:hypothetical protein